MSMRFKELQRRLLELRQKVSDGLLTEQEYRELASAAQLAFVLDKKSDPKACYFTGDRHIQKAITS